MVIQHNVRQVLIGNTLKNSKSLLNKLQYKNLRLDHLDAEIFQIIIM